jgi:hypothetical protein
MCRQQESYSSSLTFDDGKEYLKMIKFMKLPTEKAITQIVSVLCFHASRPNIVSGFETRFRCLGNACC